MKDRAGAILVGILLAVGAAATIYLSHAHRLNVTEEDVATVAAAIAGLAAYLTYRAAKESSSAAAASRKALLLHSRPSPWVMRFFTRDPRDWAALPATPNTGPMPLWMDVMIGARFVGDAPTDIEVVWAGDDGVDASPRHPSLEDGAQNFAYRLDGIEAYESDDGRRSPIAAVSRLRFYCTERATGARWSARFDSPRRELGGVGGTEPYLLNFELVE